MGRAPFLRLTPLVREPENETTHKNALYSKKILDTPMW